MRINTSSNPQSPLYEMREKVNSIVKAGARGNHAGGTRTYPNTLKDSRSTFWLGALSLSMHSDTRTVRLGLNMRLTVQRQNITQD